MEERLISLGLLELQKKDAKPSERKKRKGC